MRRWIFAGLLIFLAAGLAGAASAAQYTLFSGQAIPVGTVTVLNNGVTFTTTDDWYLREVHLMVAPKTTKGCIWPAGTLTGKGQPIPGQFPYKTAFEPKDFVDEYTFPLSLTDGTYCIAAHAAVFDTVSGCLPVQSDDATMWSADNITYQPAVATWIHPSWPSIDGATWIWRTAVTDGPAEYTTVPSGGWYFKKEFTIPENALSISGTLASDADNSESLYVNGNFVYQDGSLNRDGPDRYEWSSIQTNDVSSYLVPGRNVLIFRALNFFGYGPYTSNPAGLIFKASSGDRDGICYTHADREETAWAATEVGLMPFVTKGNWATWVSFTPLMYVPGRA